MSVALRGRLCAAFVLLCAPLAHAQSAAVVPHELLVKFRAGTSPAARDAALAALPGGRRLARFAFIGVDHLRCEALATDAALAALRARPEVEYAEPNGRVSADLTPNDTSFPTMWNLLNTGQSGAYAGDDIDATLAWNYTTGDPAMKVGVLDTGIDYTHPDLAANMWTNPGEIAGNGLDDDGNGYVDDIHGYDVLHLDGDPMDDNFHGTHVAGTIGAVGNNALGICGVTWQCQLVAVKFLDATGNGVESDAIAALQYALAAGVRLTNNSWGNFSGGQALLDAINACGAAGQLFVNAAGNNGWNLDGVPVYPACYDTPYIITVAATDGRDLRPTWSNFGATTVDLGAPGANIYSCKPGGLYQALNGTSMAAPHVAGAAMLAFARFPHASALQIRQLLLDNVDPIASLSGRTITGGRLNAYKPLLNGDATPPAATTLAVADSSATSLTVAWTAPGDDGALGTAASYDLRYATTPLDSASFAAATPVPLSPPLPGGSAELATLTNLPTATTFYIALRTTDDFGNVSALSNVAIGTTHAAPVAVGEPGASRRAALAAFRDRGTIVARLSLPEAAPVRVAAFDVRGVRVATLCDAPLGAGVQQLRWEARVAPGVYFLVADLGATRLRARVAVTR